MHMHKVIMYIAIPICIWVSVCSPRIHVHTGFDLDPCMHMGIAMYMIPILIQGCLYAYMVIPVSRGCTGEF